MSYARLVPSSLCTRMSTSSRNHGTQHLSSLLTQSTKNTNAPTSTISRLSYQHCRQQQQQQHRHHHLPQTKNPNGRSNYLRRWNSNSNKTSGKETSTTTTTTTTQGTTFLERFLAPKPMPPRNTPKWYGEMVLLCTVFGITGSSTMFMVRPAVSDVLGLKGSMKEGPWSYRICSLVIMTPIYATLLVMVGTVFGRHAYFRHFSVKMWSRFGIPPELMDKNFHQNAKNFKKW